MKTLRRVSERERVVDQRVALPARSADHDPALGADYLFVRHVLPGLTGIDQHVGKPPDVHLLGDVPVARVVSRVAGADPPADL